LKIIEGSIFLKQDVTKVKMQREVLVMQKPRTLPGLSSKETIDIIEL